MSAPFLIVDASSPLIGTSVVEGDGFRHEDGHKMDLGPERISWTYSSRSPILIEFGDELLYR